MEIASCRAIGISFSAVSAAKKLLVKKRFLFRVPLASARRSRKACRGTALNMRRSSAATIISNSKNPPRWTPCVLPSTSFNRIFSSTVRRSTPA